MCVWSLCMQREVVNMRALFSSHYTKLGCFRFSIPKSGDNKSRYNATMYACIDISNSQCVILWQVLTFLPAGNEGKENKYMSMGDRDWQWAHEEPFKKRTGRRSGSLSTYIIRPWVARELNQSTSFSWQLSHFSNQEKGKWSKITPPPDKM